MSAKKARLLVVRREAREKTFTHLLAADSAFDLDFVTTGAAALTRLDERPADIVVIDLELAGSSASELIRSLKKQHSGIEILLVGTADEKPLVSEASLPSISGYIALPATAAVARYEIERALSHRNLLVETEQLRRQVRERSSVGLGALVGTSYAMQRVYQTVHSASSSKAPWFICGESGVGKRVLARLVHASSLRASAPLVWFRTTGDDDDSAYQRLFGEKGMMAAAEGGTLVIEHVSGLAPSLQLGLLHALEHGEVDHASHTPRRIDVRIIATDTRDPAREVQAGRLRETLYERLRAVEVAMPPLRERSNDVLLLAEHFLERFAEQNQRVVNGFTARARAKLASHNWPGNVRGLEQVIESAVMLARGPSIDAQDLGFEPDVSSPHEPRIPGSTMADIEKHAILQTLDSVGGSTARAAEILDVSVRTIQYRLHEYGISPKRKESRPQLRATSVPKVS